MKRASIWTLLAWLALTVSPVARPSSSPGVGPMAVRFREGLTHGFLRLATMDGTPIAAGELTQRVAEADVTSRLVFHFKDGSSYDDTTVFTQRDRFHLVKDHVVEKGPSFPNPLDETIDATTGDVRVAYLDEGKWKDASAHLELPEDVSNGMLLQIIKNMPASAEPASVSLVVATPRPRLVRLVITAAGETPFSAGTAGQKATRYRIHVDLPGFEGLLARLFGKQPPDAQVWILHDEAPAFIAAELPLATGGPLWKVSLVAPTLATGR